MPKGPFVTIVETNRFELYTDKLGKYWLWNKIEEVNHVVRATTEREAWTRAVDCMANYMEMYKAGRKEACDKLQLVETFAKDVFELIDEDEACRCGY